MTNDRDGRADLDFLVGTWKIHNRRLKERLKSCEEWEEFEGISTARHILGGMGNADEVKMHRSSGVIEGFTVRLYDPKSCQWSIYWADSVNGKLELPMIGGFEENGHGEFYSQEPFEGRAIFSRFLWTVHHADSCRWEQAFSTDGGKTWETNWIMDLTRQS